MTKLTRVSFGETPDGRNVDRITIGNRAGVEVDVLTYGATIAAIRTADRHGDIEDIVHGFDDLTGYLTKSRYFGAVVGRYGNRIAKGQFTLDGVGISGTPWHRRHVEVCQRRRRGRLSR